LLPLEGIKILELTTAWFGPYSTVLLSDMGAEVIKIERREPLTARGMVNPRTDPKGIPTNFLALNRNKKSIALDISKQKAKEIVYKLVERSDVFVQNFRVGVLERQGFDYQTFCKYNPQIIYCSGTGFGLKGPHSRRAAYDIIAQGLSGLIAQTGWPGSPPTPAGTAPCDLGGSMLIAFGVMLALYVREKTGMGQELDVSLLSTAMALQVPQITSYLTNEQIFNKGMGTGHGDIPSTYGLFKTQDSWIAVGGVGEVRWSSFCKVMDMEQLQNDARFATAQARGEHMAELISIVDQQFLTKTTAEWLQLLGEADGIVGPINTYAELVKDPQVIENEYVQEIDYPGYGPVKVVGIPVNLHKTPGKIRGAPAAHGENTGDILLELGYSKEEIAQLEAEGVAGPAPVPQIPPKET